MPSQAAACDSYSALKHATAFEFLKTNSNKLLQISSVIFAHKSLAEVFSRCLTIFSGFKREQLYAVNKVDQNVQRVLDKDIAAKI